MEQASHDQRKRWAGRLAAVFYLASGLLSLVTLPLSPPDADLGALGVVSGAAVVVGTAAWFVPWQRLPRAASLALVPPGLGLIAAGNAFGGTNYFTYGVFFLLAFVWMGFAHPPGTSLLFAPLAAIAYVVPLLFVPEADLDAGLGSAAVVLPLCVLIGEALSRGTQRFIRMEAELQHEREARERQQKLEAMKSTFFRAASHELRTPITVCRGHLDVLDPSAGPEEVSQTLSIVVDELDRMGRLVQDITTLTRLEDPDALRTEVIDVAQLLAEVSVKAEPLLDGRLRVEEGDAGRVSADRHRLNQALLGMLDNAATHAGADARVFIRAVQEPGGWRFEVADDGVGFVGVDPAGLFQPFIHGPDSEGTGLGLAIVRSIARAHGGEAGARSRSAGTGHAGATFWIRIPG